MRPVIVRYETPYTSCLFAPFETGTRHFQVAFCQGSEESLIQLAKERIIYRSKESDNNTYEPLTLSQRSFHCLIGLLETVGYLTFFLPFITAAVVRCLTVPTYANVRSNLRIHLEEGGSCDNKQKARRNPFVENGAEDPFYQGASWLREKKL